MTRTCIACLVLGLALAACGDDTTGTVTASPDTTDAATSSTATGSTEPTEPADDTTTNTSASTSASTSSTTAEDDGGPILGGGQGAIGNIEVTITHPDADTVEYTIGCLGDTFPVTPEVPGIDGATACERLADPAVAERLVSGPPANVACTQIYGGPDVAHITGELDGQAVDATIERSDGCGVGDWDNLLAGVLPPARGVS